MKLISKNNLLTLVSFLLLFFSAAGNAFAIEIDIAAESAILVDGESGKILYQKNIDEMMPPASMTKMMTQYLILEAIKQGKLNWEQKVQISDFVHKVSQRRNLSNVPLRIDDQYTVKELFEAASIYSANGAAIALAEAIAGSEGNFVKLMNEKAAAIGIKNVEFVNSTGLNNSDLLGNHPAGTDPDGENLISARGAALLAYRLIKDYPEILQTSSIPKKTFREGTTDAIKMDNWNWMLPSLVFAYDGLDGLKTGSSPTAGFSFTGTAKKNGIRLISVVMKTDSYKSRFSETKKLLDYGFNNFEKKELFPSNYQIPGQSELPVLKGKKKTAAITTQKPLEITIKRGEEKLYEPIYLLEKAKTVKNGTIEAPLAKGQTIGYMTVKYQGKMSEYLTSEGQNVERVKIVTAEEVKKANWFVLLFRSIGELLGKLIQIKK